MGRLANYEKMVELVNAIRHHPGHRIPFYARQLGVDNKSAYRWLTLLDERGVRLSEDDRRGLHYIDGIDRLQAARQRQLHLYR